MLTLLAAFGFVVLCVFEWRRRSRRLRIVGVVLALVLYWFAQDCLYCALRGAMDTPPAARDTLWGTTGPRLGEYHTGVKTMYRQALVSHRFYTPTRHITVAVLAWLALAPALRSVRGARETEDAPTRDTGSPAPLLPPVATTDDLRDRGADA